MNILDLIDSNNNSLDQQDRINDFESKSGIILPPVYKSFIINFNSQHILDDKLLCYYNEQYSTTLQLYDAEYKTDSRVAMHDFWELEKILTNMKNIYNQEGDEKIGIDNYIGLGECSNQGILLLGIAKVNSDEIFIEYHHEEPRIVKIENNIFDFLRSYNVELNLIDLPKETTKENLYKRWGEKFWRLDDQKK